LRLGWDKASWLGSSFQGICTLSSRLFKKIVYNIRVIRKSPCLRASFPPLSPLLVIYSQNKEIWLNLSMKCWNSAFNTQNSRVIIIVVQVGSVKIYEQKWRRSGKKERQDETRFTTKNDGVLSFTSSKCLCTFCQVLRKFHPMYDETECSGAVFSLVYENSIAYDFFSF
jgi:hypothetical protein